MFTDLLRRELDGIVELGGEQVKLLENHYNLLVRWNAKLNLTAIRDLEDAVRRHYCESLFLGAHLPAGRLRIADVGAGAGFPGFPVAVLRPDCSVTLIESHQRKAVFLKEATRNTGVRVIAKRGAAVDEEFDHVISRAVSYADLIPFLRRLGAATDLLTGPEDPPEGMGFDWGPPIVLPWGSRRYLRQGTAKVKVSRETDCST